MIKISISLDTSGWGIQRELERICLMYVVLSLSQVSARKSLGCKPKTAPTLRRNTYHAFSKRSNSILHSRFVLY